MARNRKDVIALEPIEIPTPEIEPEVEADPGNAALRRGPADVPELDEPPTEPVEPTPAGRTPLERAQDRQLADLAARAQGMGDAYRGMSDDEVARREASATRSPSGATLYPPGTVPPPASRVDALRQQQASPAPAPTSPVRTLSPPPESTQPAPPGIGSLLADPGGAPPLASKGPDPGPPRPERDMTPVDISDAIHRVLYGLGAGLTRASGGGDSAPFVGGRQLIEARDRQMAEDKGREGDRISQRDAREAQLGMQREQMDASQRARSEDLALRREALTSQDARSRAELEARTTAAASDPRRQAVMEAAREREAMRQADTPESERQRELLLDALTTAERNPVLARMYAGIRESVPQMTGERASALLSRLNGNLSRMGIRGSAGAGGAGAPRGGIPREAWGTEQDPLYQEALRYGTPPITARSMASDPRTRRTLEEDLAGRGQSERQAQQTREQDARTPSREQSDRAIVLSAAEDAIRQAVEALPPEGEDIPGVGPIDARRGMGLLQSAAGRRIRTLGSNAVRRFLRLESGAAISDEEMNQEMQLRGMGENATEQDYRNGLRDLERDIARRRQTLQGGLESQPTAAPSRQQGAPPNAPVREPRGDANPRPGMVYIEHPQRGRGWIPEARLQEALRAGAREVQP